MKNTYLEELKGLAIEYSNQTSKPSITAGQSILETGGGKHAPGNNYFGIKWIKGKAPESMRQTLKTQEWNIAKGKYETVMADFMKFETMRQSVEWYAEKVVGLPRYKPTRESKDFIEAATNIRLNGYATSPSYTKNLLNVILKYKLYELDYLMSPKAEMTKNFLWGEFFCSEIINGKYYYRIIEPPPDTWKDLQNTATEAQKIRDHYGIPVYVESGWRSTRRNAQLPNSSPKSQHLYGRALDLDFKGKVKIWDAYQWIKENTEFNRFGIGKRTLHADTAKPAAIWYYN